MPANAVATPLTVAGVTGLVAAAALPLDRVGIGWVVTIVAIGAAVAVARRRPPSAVDESADAPASEAASLWTRGEIAGRAVTCAAAIALASVGAVRAAGWLVAVCLVAAVLLGSYALVGGRTWGELGLAALALPRAWLRLAGPNAARLVVTPVGGRAAGALGGRTMIGLIAGLVLVGVFGLLFAFADHTFAYLIADAVPDLTLRGTVRGVVAFFVVAAVTVAAVLASRAKCVPSLGGRHTLGRPEWVIPLVLLDLLFAVFVVVQLPVLFAGHAYVLGNGGPDYAVYARGGFRELLLVTILTLGVVAVVARWASRATRTDRVLIRVLVGLLCGLTLIVIASALKRMELYADAYGFTRARLLADTVQVWIGLLFVLLIAAGVTLRARWFPRAALAAAVAVLFGLVAINPDALIARSIIGRYDRNGYPIDYYYLSTLSADAVPEFRAVWKSDADPLRSQFLQTLDVPDPWYGWNASRVDARRQLRAWLELYTTTLQPPQ